MAAFHEQLLRVRVVPVIVWSCFRRRAQGTAKILLRRRHARSGTAAVHSAAGTTAAAAFNRVGADRADRSRSVNAPDRDAADFAADRRPG